MIGASIPIARAATVSTRPITVSFHPWNWNFFCTRPNTMANAMNNREMVPAAPFVLAASASFKAPSTSVYALNVPATISANAAITRSVNSQQNNRNNFLPNLPIYFSIKSPIDFPSFLTLAYKAPKSVTAPKKMPPISTHSKTGSHPNTAA